MVEYLSLGDESIGTTDGSGFSDAIYKVFEVSEDIYISSFSISYYEYSGTPNLSAVLSNNLNGSILFSSASIKSHGSTSTKYLDFVLPSSILLKRDTPYTVKITPTSSIAKNTNTISNKPANNYTHHILNTDINLKLLTSSTHPYVGFRLGVDRLDPNRVIYPIKLKDSKVIKGWSTSLAGTYKLSTLPLQVGDIILIIQMVDFTLSGLIKMSDPNWKYTKDTIDNSSVRLIYRQITSDDMRDTITITSGHGGATIVHLDKAKVIAFGRRSGNNISVTYAKPPLPRTIIETHNGDNAYPMTLEANTIEYSFDGYVSPYKKHYGNGFTAFYKNYNDTFSYYNTKSWGEAGSDYLILENMNTAPVITSFKIEGKELSKIQSMPTKIPKLDVINYSFNYVDVESDIIASRVIVIEGRLKSKNGAVGLLTLMSQGDVQSGSILGSDLYENEVYKLSLSIKDNNVDSLSSESYVVYFKTPSRPSISIKGISADKSNPTSVSTRPTIRWSYNDLDGDAIKSVEFMVKDSNGTSYTETYTPTGTDSLDSYTLKTGLVSKSSYEISVRVTDTTSMTSDWSVCYIFTDNAPNSPIALYPKGNIRTADREPFKFIMGEDIDLDSQSFDLQISSDENFTDVTTFSSNLIVEGWGVVDDKTGEILPFPYGSGVITNDYVGRTITFTPPSLPEWNTFYWRVRGVSNKVAYGQWSEVCQYRLGNKIEIRLREPIVTNSCAKRITASLRADIPEGVTYELYATNNVFDSNPVWEDIKHALVRGSRHEFVNDKLLQSNMWGLDIKLIINANNSTEPISLEGFGFSFD